MSVRVSTEFMQTDFFREKTFTLQLIIYLVECPFMRSCICSAMQYMLVFHILVSIRRDLSEYIYRLEI